MRFLEAPDIRIPQEKRGSKEYHNASARYPITVKGGLQAKKKFFLPPTNPRARGRKPGREK